MENKLTTDVTIDVAEVDKGPLAGKVFPVEYLKAEELLKTAPTIRLGRNVYALNKPLDDCRAKGVYIAHVCTGTTHSFWLWIDAGKWREPCWIWRWNGVVDSDGRDKVIREVCKLVRKRHRSG